MIAEMQDELKEWTDINFPEAVWEDAFMGVTEEVGELAHALLKQKQNIRGDKWELEDAAKDAVADTIIYLFHLCTLRGWDLESILIETIGQITDRNWNDNPLDGVNE